MDAVSAGIGHRQESKNDFKINRSGLPHDNYISSDLILVGIQILSSLVSTASGLS